MRALQKKAAPQISCGEKSEHQVYQTGHTMCMSIVSQSQHDLYILLGLTKYCSWYLIINKKTPDVCPTA